LAATKSIGRPPDGAQYIILGIFLVLKLWTCGGLAGDAGEYYSLAAERTHPQRPILAPRGKIVDRRRPRFFVETYPSFSALLLRDSSRDLNADADLLGPFAHGTKECARLPSLLRPRNTSQSF